MDRRARALIVFLLPAVAGCGSGSPSGRDTPSATGADLRRYEETFRPSEFDPPPSVALREKPPGSPDSTILPQRQLNGMPQDLVPGFRVQIFSSTDIDEANGMRLAAEERFPGERFYVVYEPPAYKVRAGDFQERYDADRLARSLREGGYSDSWIVPDRVLKNPPSKVLDPAGGGEPRR